MNTMLRISAVLTMLALALMVWSMLQPTPLPVMLAMSVGQVIGTAAFGLYGFVIFKDIRRAWRERKIERVEVAARERQAETDRIATIAAEKAASKAPAKVPEKVVEKVAEAPAKVTEKVAAKPAESISEAVAELAEHPEAESATEAGKEPPS